MTDAASRDEEVRKWIELLHMLYANSPYIYKADYE
jgi:hypothetical protein